MFLGKRELELPGALGKEWICANGAGGYASSTVADVHTRRYHGWLMAATEPPGTRFMLFSRFMETVTVSGRSTEFSSAEYPGTFHPTGFTHLVGFWDDPVPSFLYSVGGQVLVRQIFFPEKKNVCVVAYRALETGRPLYLDLKPLFNWRHYHHLTQNPHSGFRHSSDERSVQVISPSSERIELALEQASFTSSPNWYHRTLYRAERDRGLDYLEDHYCPGAIQARLSAENGHRVAFAIGPGEEMRDFDLNAVQLPSLEPERYRGLLPTLERTARSFLVNRGAGRSVIAGYHWFSDWGRDTMISTPGLTLATGRPEEALLILQTWGESRREGLIPNRFGDSESAPEWNSVDAPLWFVYAAWKYWQYTHDTTGIRPLLGILQEVAENYLRGTLFGIVADRSHLVRAGQQGMQLTWMDAKVHDEVVTQRAGYAVDVNALWYNALMSISDLLEKTGDRAKGAYYRQIAKEVRDAFSKVFWNGLHLRDVVPGGDELRPNQILAVSLPFSPLSAEQQKGVVDAVEDSLYTPYGIRTLCPLHHSYRGRYRGGVEERDRAYHQGTAWPWLTGQFITAKRRTKCPAEMLWQMVLPFEGHLREAGIGSISEVFDGDFPYEPGGAVSQAWSVGEILRATYEDAMGNVQIFEE